MKKGLIYGLGGAVLLVAALLTALAWTPIDDFDREAILKTAASHDVTVHRDTYGVPHIYGTSDADVAFGLGYAHSEDDFENIALSIAMSRGEHAKYVGRSGAQTDYLVALFQIWDLVDARYETDLSPETRALVEAYADGVNLYALEHGEGNWSGILPVTGKDVIAGFVFRTPFFFGFERELGRIFDPKGFEGTDKGDVTAVLLNGSKVPMGSNAFALAPSRSAEGITRLAVNSHQPFEGPVAWYEVVVHSEEGWHMAGSTFPGGPLVLHGHNENLGWAQTVNQPDLTDVYEITVNPKNENEYFYDGAWRAFESWKAPIRVRLFGPFSWVFKQEALSTEYGPAIRLDHGTFAMRHAGMDEVRQIEQTYLLNKSATYEDWRAAMDMQAFPATNYVYADKTGRIAYFYNAHMPKRPEGYDWSGLVPGDTSATQWQGFHDLSEIPHYVSPESGYLLNSNNQPFQATDDAFNLSAEDYPESFGIEEEFSNRARRGLSLFSDLEKISREDFYRVKFDKGYHRDSKLMTLLEPLRTASSEDADVASAIALLRAWKGTAEVDDPYAALAIVTALRLNDAEDLDLAEQIEVLRSVQSELVAAHGRVDVAWGEVNRIRRGEIDLPVGGGPDTLRAIYGGSDLGANGTLTAMAGDTYVMMVEWDKNGRVSSESIHQYGSATMDATSPHYGDQVEMFTKETFKPVWFELEDLQGHIKETYRPGHED